jgi:hypothetical protein
MRGSVKRRGGWVSQAQGWICLEAWLSEDLRPDRQKEFWINGLLKKIP